MFDWQLFGLLAYGSAPSTVASLIALSMLDLSHATGGHVITLALVGVLSFTAIFLLCAKAFIRLTD
jgi:hypothetical protein